MEVGNKPTPCLCPLTLLGTTGLLGVVRHGAVVVAVVFGVVCHRTLMEVVVVFAVVTDGGRETVFPCDNYTHPLQNLRKVLWIDVTHCT